MRHLFNLAAFIQIISPFIHVPYCAGAYINDKVEGEGWGWFVNGGLPSLNLMAVIDLLSCFVFGYDLFLYLSVDYENKRIITDPWTLLRAIGSFLLACSIISYLSWLLRLPPLLEIPVSLLHDQQARELKAHDAGTGALSLLYSTSVASFNLFIDYVGVCRLFFCFEMGMWLNSSVQPQAVSEQHCTYLRRDLSR